MGTLLQDLRYAARLLAKRPGFTLVAVLTLALGIGANAAIFSVVNAVLIRPLPYLASERLVVVEAGKRHAEPEDFAGVAPADFLDFQAQSQAFEHLAAVSGGGFSLTGVEDPETLPASRVTVNFFDAFGARPLLGRVFSAEENSLRAPAAVVLSHRLWQRRFGGDPNIVGKTLGDTGATVIGVMPADFKFPASAELWMPLTADSPELRNRANRYLSVAGLLRLGQTVAGAEAELRTIAARLEAQYPDTNKDIDIRLTPFRDRLVRDVKPSLMILLGAVGLVLLVCCANVANLLLARAASRRKEMAIRMAMGAGRWRLVRQLLIESLMLASAGAAAGLLIALWSVDLLVRLLPQTYAHLQLQDEVRLDGAVLFFMLGLTLLTGLVFGLAPALQASRPDPIEGLKEGGRGTQGPQSQRTRGALVTAEIAVALVLLIGAGLLIQSFMRLRRADLGFDPRNLMTFNLTTPFNRFPDDGARVRFIGAAIEQVAQVPGVEAVTTVSGLAFPYLNFNFRVEGRPDEGEHPALYEVVSPNYFRALRAPLIAGREFTDRDTAESPRVAIVNERLARQHFPGEDPLGKRLSINYLGSPRTFEIVGVVRDMSQGEPGKVRPGVYVCYRQQPWLSASLVVRAGGDVAAVRKQVQKAIWAADPRQPVSRVEFVEAQLSNALAEPRLYSSLLGGFAGLALLLAAVGIYGVMSYSVAERTHEIGVRMALGARGGDVLRLVVGQAMKLVVAGVGIGWVAAYGLTRVLAGSLYGILPTDVKTFAGVSLVLVIIALLACYVPARRATRVDPMEALRYE